MKYTKRQMFNAILNICADSHFTCGEREVEVTAEELTDFLNNELALLDKRAEAKSAKSAKDSTALFNELLEVMEANKQYTATEVGKLLDLNCQKVAPSLNKMVAEGLLTVVMDKKKKYFVKEVA